MKTKIFIVTLMLLGVSFFALTNANNASASNATKLLYPHLTATVYGNGNNTLQSGCEVKLFIGSSEITNLYPTETSTGVYDFDMSGQSNTTYTVKAWKPARPNDGQNGQANVNFTGIDASTSFHLGPNY